MIRLLTAVFQWLFSKTAMALMLWIIVLAGAALYLASRHYMEQLPRQLAEHEAELAQLRQAARDMEAKVLAASEEAKKRAAHFDQEMAKVRAVIDEKKKDLQDLQARLESLRGAAGQVSNVLDFVLGARRNNDAERAGVESKLNETRRQLGGFQSALETTAKEKESALAEAEKARASLDQERQNVAGRAKDKEAKRNELSRQLTGWQGWVNRATYWLRNAYEKVGRPLILVTLSLIFAPLIGKALLYFLWAPLVGLSRPVVISKAVAAPIDVSETKVSQEVILAPGETATIHHKFYQASDEDLRKRSKFVFHWRYPFSCVSAGLIMLTRATNRTEQPRRLVLSSQQEPDVELAVASIPDGGALVCRPSFLAALIESPGKRPEIRSHWRFFRLHSWITLQFRYFEFRGPVKLVLWAHRGVRAERLSETGARERRTNQLATIAFTPNLRYKSRRSETFLSYLRNENPLFDDLFSGNGTFLCQQISRSDRAKKVGRFWEGVWNGITKIFGI